jgi:hypothetical protein
MTKRTDLLRTFAAQAKAADARNDTTLRNQASNNWRENASDAEAAKAPKYLTWTGRK